MKTKVFVDLSEYNRLKNFEQQHAAEFARLKELERRVEQQEKTLKGEGVGDSSDRLIRLEKKVEDILAELKGKKSTDLTETIADIEGRMEPTPVATTSSITTPPSAQLDGHQTGGQPWYYLGEQ